MQHCGRNNYILTALFCYILTCSFVSNTVSLAVDSIGLADFQNCFCAEYRFMGHILKRQSRQEKIVHCTHNQQQVLR